jgi:type II secretory pathway component PulF
MGQAAWAAFLRFWGWVLLVFFGTVAFMLLRWRNRKFNMKNDDDPMH